ncbi:MAG: hypothetical protein K0M40_22510 [Prolixibacteraceae bacterium]|nr:hypothetical protein [Prolixibacteraceae bacterium]
MIARQIKPRYSKSLAVKMLEELATNEAKRLHPNTPERFIAPRTFTDKTANGLTACIVQYIRLAGGQAERISNTGRMIDTRTTFEDVVGRSRTIGSTKWIKGTGTNGTADVAATITGHSVKIEVKIGHDSQSKAQKDYQKSIEAAGGIYIIASSFQQFWLWFQLTFREVQQ